MKLRKIVAILGALAVILSIITACADGGQSSETPEQSSAAAGEANDPGNDGQTMEDPIRITFVSPLVASPYFVTMENGIKAAAAELGIEVECVGTNTVDLNKWMEYIDAAIANDTDALITMVLNEAAISPAIALANEKNIPVILVDTDAPNTGRTSYLGTNNYEAGRVLGEELARLTGGEAKIGLVSGALDQPNLNERVEGFREAIGAYPGMEIVAFEVDDSDMAKCIEVTEAMLTAHPEITALAGCETFCVPGFSRVVSERDLQDTMTVVGFDDNDDTLAAIRNGVADGTIVQKQYMMGYEAVMACYEVLNGNQVPEIVDTGVVFLSADNIDSYNPESVG